MLLGICSESAPKQFNYLIAGAELTEKCANKTISHHYLGRVKRILYLSPMRAAKVQASLRIGAVSPEPPLLAHTSSESRGTFRQKARSLAPLNCWACAVKVCHDGMLEDTNSLDAAHLTTDHSVKCKNLNFHYDNCVFEHSAMTNFAKFA